MENQNGFKTGTAIFMLAKHKLHNLWREGGFFSEWEYYQERLAEKKITKKKLTEDAKEECWDRDLFPEYERDCKYSKETEYHDEKSVSRLIYMNIERGEINSD